MNATIINVIQLLSILKNTTATTIRVVNRSESIINYKNLEKEILCRKLDKRPVPHLLDEVKNLHNLTATVEGTYSIGGLSYGQRVNKALSEKGLEPNFKSRARSFGDWIVENSAMEYNGNAYIRGYFTGKNMPKVSCDFAGEHIENEVLKELGCFNGVKIGNKKQRELGLETDECINVRVIPLDSISEIQIGDKVYHIR